MQRYLLFWEKIWATCHTLSQYKNNMKEVEGLIEDVAVNVKYKTMLTALPRHRVFESLNSRKPLKEI